MAALISIAMCGQPVDKLFMVSCLTFCFKYMDCLIGAAVAAFVDFFYSKKNFSSVENVQQ